MKVLGIDGALGEFSVAVADNDCILAVATIPDKTALERGMEAIASTLREAGISGEQLDRLAVGIGPGRFTGMRIALAYTKSLAQGWGKPLVPISSFDLVECGHAIDPVLTIVVGRPGIISLRLRRGDRIVRVSGRTEEAIASSRDALRDAACSGTLAAIGAPQDALAALAAQGVGVRSLEPLATPAAVAAARLGSVRAPARTAHEIRADYGESKG